MFQAIEAEIDIHGNVKLLEKLILKNTKKALVIVLEDAENKHETALLSESVLARDWNRPEEDEAWSQFQ
jgi:hypothetical protein